MASTRSNVTIEDILTDNAVSYILDAVKTWGGANPRILMPINPLDRSILYLLVSKAEGEQFADSALESDLSGKLNCLVLIEDEEYVDRDDFEKKIYRLEDKEALRKDFADICFKPPVPSIDDPDSARSVLVGIFKPEIKAEKLKRRHENNASGSSHGSSDNDSNNSTPRSGQ